MNELSKERLENYASGSWYPDADYVKAMARELLAYRKERERAEPVAWMLTDNEFGHSVATKAGFTLNFYRSKGWGVTPLYTAAPAPVVPEEATPDNIDILASIYAPRGVTYQWDIDERNAAADSWNACRVAMFDAAAGKDY